MTPASAADLEGLYEFVRDLTKRVAALEEALLVALRFSDRTCANCGFQEWRTADPSRQRGRVNSGTTLEDEMADSDVDLIGPMAPPTCPTYRVAYRGCMVPRVTVNERADGWEILLDGRMAHEGFTRAEVERIIPMLADMQAIGAGYGCHGLTERHSEYAVRAYTITLPPPELTLLGSPSDNPDEDGTVGRPG